MKNERLMKVLLGPIISEKSTIATEMANQYAFRVVKDATKQEIRRAVELLFEVEVEGVQVVNIKGKVKRFGRMLGRRSDVRKAYVRLAPGQTIDIGGA